YADGAPLPKRYVYCYGGHSLAFGYNDPSLPEYYRQEPRDMFVPDTVGAKYDLKLALTPLGDYGVQDFVSVVSALRVPYAVADNEAIPRGGTPNHFHGYTLKPIWTGMNSGGPASPSSDQVVAQAIAGDTIFPSINYGIQPVSYW